MLSKRLQVLLCSLLAAALLCSAVLARLGGKADFITPDTTTLDLNSCRHTHPDAVRGEASANELASLDGYALLAENDRLALYLREDICNVRVLNKQTGYVWGSVPADGAQGLNDTWTALAQSLVTFTYLNEECMSSQISAGDPRVERTLEKTADGGVLQINDTRTGISFAVALRLQGDGISVSMVEDSLQEDGSNSRLVTGVSIVNNEFLAAHKDLVDTFLTEHEASIAYTADDPEGAAALIEKAGIVAKAAIAQKALPACNITYLDGQDMKDALNGYLSVLLSQNPQSVGGSLPEDDFYYLR